MNNENFTPNISPLAKEYLIKKLQDESRIAHRRQGLIGKGLDVVKSTVGYGKCKKNVNKKIADFEQGKTDFQTADKYIKDYRYAQRDASEISLDILSGSAAFGMFSISQKLIQFVKPFLGNKAAGAVGKFAKPVGFGLSIVTGFFSKPILRFFDRIYLKKAEKKDNKCTAKDIVTGALNGAVAPLAMLKAGFVGIPLVLGENTLQRYLFVKRGDKKSMQDFIDKQKDNLVLKAAAGGLLAYKTHKLNKSLKGWDDAIRASLKNIEDLKNPFEKGSNSLGGIVEMAEQATLLFDPKFITEFMSAKTIEDQMRIIEAKNIFLPKFLQTIPENVFGALGKSDFEFMGIKLSDFGGNLEKIITRFKSDCPQSRTIEEAQEFISKTYGDKYTIIRDKALGVGTVAETFLAKDNTTGKEVVLKFLKKGMSLEKIENDRKTFLELLKSSKMEDAKKKDALIRKVNSLYDDWSREVDLEKEMEATQILGKNAKHYNAVRAIETKDNIYVMEKAPGVQFNEFIEDMMKKNKTLSEKQMFHIMTNYLQVFFEQLLSVPKKGTKVMHADPHPGNIFIDINNLEKPFTFIDTGNVMRYTPAEAIENTLNHLDYFIGNSKGIAKALLRNASLPEGMTQKQAVELIAQKLDTIVYNKHSKLIGNNPLDLFNDVNEVGFKIMEENNIIPNLNNANLLKAEMTYLSNLTCLKDIDKIIDRKGEKISEIEAKEQAKMMLKEIGQALLNATVNNKRYTTKEVAERLKFIENNKEQFYSTILSFSKI